MAVWENAIITNRGLALLAKLASGNSLSLVRAVAGSGTVDPAELQYQTAVAEEKQDLTFGIQSYPEEGKCAVTVRLNNTAVSNAYFVNQIGIMAFDPDDGEILLLISQEASGTGTEVPSEAQTPGFSVEWTFYIQYGQADGVEVTVDPSNTVSAGEVQAMLDAALEQAMEQITPEWLGLDNVDNTPDTEKHVAYAQRAGNADKVQYALTVRLNGGRDEGSDMWTFDGSTSRTVNITADKIGAAEADHTHTAEDVGALPAAGGTLTGPLNLTENVHYGDTLPTDPDIGMLFFLDEDAADALGV